VELEAGTQEVVEQLSKAEAARKAQRESAEGRLAAAKKAAEELAEKVAAERGVVRERSKALRRAEELLEEARTGLKQAELQVCLSAATLVYVTSVTKAIY
jgi:predicted  nucleic acid-binding Zn-ribbon protein